MKIGDCVYLLSGECRGESGTVCSFGPLSDQEPWVIVRLVEHPEWCRRVTLKNLAAMPDYPPPIQPPSEDCQLNELPRAWAWALV